MSINKNIVSHSPASISSDCNEAGYPFGPQSEPLGVWQKKIGLLSVLALLNFTAVYAQVDIDELSNIQAGEKKISGDVQSLNGRFSTSIYEKISTDQYLSSAPSITRPPSELDMIDKKIDDSAYVLGTGDELAIHIWGSVNKTLYAQVDPEGNLLIPSVGIIGASGKILADAKKEIEEQVLTKYKKVEMTITLNSIRTFKAYIVGDVLKPGGYIVNGASRVTDLINAAGGLAGDNTRMRGIEISNELYPTRHADLALFFHNNDIEYNPYLQEGDRVFVNPRKEIVSISGEVFYPDSYDYVPDDSLSTLLRVAGGLTRNADTSKILITRFFDDFDSLVYFQISLSEAHLFKLQRDDRVLACNIPEYRPHLGIEIKGEVKYPGIYPIQKNRTRLKDVISMAGGLTDEAFLQGSTIQRTEFNQARDREFERLKATPIEALTPLERSYLKTKQIEKEGRISIDFEDLYYEDKDIYNIILTNNDIINIEKKNLTVSVMGAVVSPGLVSHSAGKDHIYYIRQAGGFNSRARKNSIMIIKGGTGIWLKPRETKAIEPGDKIWIAEKEYRNWFKLTQEMLAILGSVAIVITSYLTIRELTK